MKASLVALEITVYGAVQGVGFRPFVFNLANELGISGSVKNRGGTVVIEAWGNSEAIEQFVSRLQKNPPALAQIVSVDMHNLPVNSSGSSSKSFVIMDSDESDSDYCMVPPDTAVCAACEREMLDKSDRRYNYPFINCTDCGPRFTIINDLPYDRTQTTMASFTMCESCNAEYKDPANRRFHAQPNACWQCGPRLSFVYKHEAAARALVEETERTDSSEHHQHAAAVQADPIGSAIAVLRNGGILALKALGGFQLICDARSEAAVRTLRERKRRCGKPLAVMFPDVQSLEKLCEISEEELKLLTGARRPIVLLKCKLQCHKEIAHSVTNNNYWLGAMLPYTPLHSLLLHEFGGPFVATSGNLSEEPIAIDNAEALIKLQGLADGFLIHNREIETRFDDSVTSVICGEPTLIRRARGYAPQPVVLPMVPDKRSSKTVLSLGGHLKNTFCLLRGNLAYVSQHLGDLNNIETFEFFEETIWKYQQLFRMAPDIVACDLHPEYLSTKLADRIIEATSLPVVRVQHHHAHIASCMAENSLRGPVIGVSFDGTGYGTDGTIWGGEYLVCTYKDFERLGSLQPFPLPGGDAVSKHPWKVSVALLNRLQSSAASKLMNRYEEDQGKNPVGSLRRQINSNVNTVKSTSTGRLFDAVSSLLGFCHDSTFDGDAPMRMETAAWRALESEKGEVAEQFLSLGLVDFHESGDSRNFLIDSTTCIEQLCSGMMQGREPNAMSLSFHRAMATAVVNGCRRIADLRKITTVCLSGGVFQNRLLTELVITGLQAADLEVFVQRRLPCNDGGLSLGQSLIALAKMNELEFVN
jgi:hydrogenase maturation protein HypF